MSRGAPGKPPERLATEQPNRWARRLTFIRKHRRGSPVSQYQLGSLHTTVAATTIFVELHVLASLEINLLL